MSKSKTAREAGNQKNPNGNTADSLEQKVLEFAEQLGWLVGTVNARSEGWLDRKALGAQVGRIRDGAAELIGQLTSDGPQKSRSRNGSRASKKASSRASKKVTTRGSAAPVKDRGPVDAPGKRHRPAPPATHGIKHSDERVAKVIMSRQITRRPRG